MIRCAVLLAAVVVLAGCQITIGPVLDDYYGLRATFTWAPVLQPDASPLPDSEGQEE